MKEVALYDEAGNVVAKNYKKEVLERAFPVTLCLLQKEQGNDILETFLNDATNSSTPYLKLPSAFSFFIKTKKYSEEKGYSWLHDLMDFELRMFDVLMMPSVNQRADTGIGSYLTDKLALNQEYALFKARYPVHTFRDGNVDLKRKPVYLLIFRDPVTKRSRCIELTDFTNFIIHQLYSIEVPVSEMLPQAAQNFGVENYMELENSMIKFLFQLHQQGAILGFKF